MGKKANQVDGKKQPRRTSPRSDPSLRLWATHQEESVYFQREAQVNFWTVLGGLAMAALLTQLAPLLAELRAGRWHLLLYLIASILVLASSWVQTSWGSLVMKWPISIFTTVTTLFGMLAQSIQCLLVTDPAGWLAATAVVIFFALLVQVYFSRSQAWSVFPKEFIKRFRANNLAYVFFLLLCLGGAAQLFFFPSLLAETAWGVVVLALAIAALVMQHKGMQEEKRALDIP